MTNNRLILKDARLLFIAVFAALTLIVNAQTPPAGGAPKTGTPPQGGAPGGQMPAIGKVMGTVVDSETGKPISYAVVSVIKIKDKSVTGGGYTDDKGYFQLENLPLGLVKLKVTFIGYLETQTDSFLLLPKNPEKFFEKINLRPNSKQLKTVEVAADKSMLSGGIDKKIYNVEKDLSNTGGSAVDVLQNVPSVTVDQDKNISLRGANVNILIDGKPSNMTAAGALDQLPAGSIDRIEVITNPSAKYDPDGVGGIINIILKKNDKPGFNGSVNATVGNGDKYNGGINLNARGKKLNIAASYNYMNQRFFNLGSSITKYSQDTLYFMDQTSNGYSVNESHMGRIALDWNINKFNNLSAAFTPSWRQNTNPNLIKYFWYDSVGDTLDYFTRDNTTVNRSINYDASVNYARTFRKPGIDYTADFYISYSAPTDSLDAFQSYYDAANQPWMSQLTQNTSKNLILTGQTDYSMRLGESYKIETGLKTIARKMDYNFYSKRAYENNTNYTPDVNLNNGFTYSDQVYSAYGTFTGSYKKLGYSAGLRAEQTFYTVDQKTLNQKFNRNYFSLFPSAFLKYKMNEGAEFGFSYSRRINRPRGWDLNPFPDYSDPYFLFVGNPYLNPEYVNSFDVSAQVITKKITIAPSVYYRYTTGVFTRFRSVDSLGVSRITSFNLNTSHSGGIDLTLRYDATKWWRINLNGGAFYTRLNANNLQQGLSAGRWGGMGRAMMSFKPLKGLDVQLSYSLGVPWVFTQGYIRPFQNMDISVKYDFWKDRLSVVARLSDVFDQRQFGYVTEGIGFNQDGLRKRETRWVNLSITWKFGKLIPQSKRPKSAPSEMQDNGGGGGGF